jgi:hypothetical protein
LSKTQVSAYLDEESYQYIEQMVKSTGLSLSATVNMIVISSMTKTRKGSRIDRVEDTTDQSREEHIEPKTCPECGKGQDELGNPALIIQESNYTWHCALCNERGEY